MPSQRTLSQWIAVAAVVPTVLFAIGDVRGQAQSQGSAGTEAVFQGRSAMGGAQAGTGAMAGPPQGGLGPQSTDQPGGGLVLRAPAAVRDQQAVPKREGSEMGGARDPGVGVPSQGDVAPRKERDTGDVLKRDRDSSGSTESTGKKVKRSAKRTYERSRHGVPGIN